MTWTDLAAVGGIVLGAAGLVRAWLADRRAAIAEGGKQRATDATVVIEGLGELAQLRQEMTEDLRKELLRERQHCQEEMAQAIQKEREECEAKIIEEATKLSKRLDAIAERQDQQEATNGNGAS